MPGRPKRRKNKSSSGSKPVVSTLNRHSIKGKTGPYAKSYGLIPEGVELAESSAETLPEGRKAKVYVSGSQRYPSTSVRAAATGSLQRASYRKSGRGNAFKTRIRRKPVLSFDFMHNEKKEAALEKKYGEEGLLRRWLDGKVPRSIMDPYEEVADKIIRERFGLGQRLARMGRRDLLLHNVTHGYIVEAVFTRLTGRRFENTRAPKPPPASAHKGPSMVRETEGLKITHYKNGRAVLRYRGRSYEVTTKLKQILKK